MRVEKAVKLYSSYLKDNSRPNTVRNFSFALNKFNSLFSDQEIDSIKESDIVNFVSSVAESCSASTKSSRVGTIRALFNFIIEVTEANFINPCQKPMIKKLFKGPRISSPKLLEKDTIDEIIFRTVNERDRLILELMGRSGMRVGEVLNIRRADINFDNSTILITEPKSGRLGEQVYVTKKLCGKLHTYIAKLSDRQERVFNISYSTTYRMVRRAGKIMNSFLRPHDLRRHAATQASRNNIPLEIVSKVILRHADISTTQRYLGSIDHEEASRWVEHLNR
ncbi:MAG: tyrosine-type recombinase/integrase [Limnohabitans sp.]